MGLRGRLRKLERESERGLDTYRCAGCGERFKVPAGTWLDLITVAWAEGMRERRGDPAPRADELCDRNIELLETHLDHGDIYDEAGGRVWPPSIGSPL